MRKAGLLCVLVSLAIMFFSDVASGGFSDNFDDGDISDWTVVTDGNGIFEASTNKYVSSPYSVHMKSLTNGDKATGESPTYELDLSGYYEISFSFLIPHTNNHWFEVFNNHQIYLVIDSGDDFKCYDGSTSHLIDELDANQWHLVEVKAYPDSNSYDVYLNSELKSTCDMWIHAGYETTFRMGDRNADQTYYDYGEGYWDDIIIVGCADANIDNAGSVNFNDFSIMASDWQKVGAGLKGDINSDGGVDFNDLRILTYHWLSDCNQ